MPKASGSRKRGRETGGKDFHKRFRLDSPDQQYYNYDTTRDRAKSGENNKKEVKNRDEELKKVNEKLEGIKTFSPSIRIMCACLLQTLMNHPSSWPFNKPVSSEVWFGIDKYFEIIKKPMDLGTVRSKLRKNEYSTPLEFGNDVKLTFDNAMTFNPPDHEVYKMAEELYDIFFSEWKSIAVKMVKEVKSSGAVEEKSMCFNNATVIEKGRPKPNTMKVNKQKYDDKCRASLEQKIEDLFGQLPQDIPKTLVEFMNTHTEFCSVDVKSGYAYMDLSVLGMEELSELCELLSDYLEGKRGKISQDGDQLITVVETENGGYKIVYDGDE